MPMMLSNPRALRLTLLLQIALATLPLSCSAAASAQDWTYRVRPGDTLWDLGTRYLKPTVSWEELQGHNAVSNPYRLPPGQVLRFPIAWLRVEPAPARVVAVRGEVEIGGGDRAATAAREGMQLPIGSHIRTSADASITLAFADDSRLLLRENSELRLDQLSSYGATGMVDTRLRLQRGRSSNRVTPAQGPASRYMITAPTATSSVRGTVFRVSAAQDGGDPGATEVVEGRVQVGNRHGRQMVDPGQASLSASAARAPAPAQPLLAAPEIDTARLRLEPLPLLAAWQALPQARGYRIEVVRADAPDVLLFARDTPDSSIRIDDLPPGQLRLLVRAVDADGVEGHDSARDFRVPDGLPPPLTTAPLHAQTLNQAHPRFAWAQVAGAAGSLLQIAREPDFRQPLAESRTDATRLRSPVALAPGDYYWRVASVDALGQGGRYGQALPLRISDAPSDPGLQPAQAGKGQLTLRWQAGAEGQRYRVQMDRRGDFSMPLLDRETAAPEITMKQPWRGGTLHVRVQYIDDDGYAGPFSTAQQIRLPCKLCYGAGAGALLLLAL
ncbi:peptidoglycan-binding protein LysM [Stenotrophomonas sp. Leaf70]|uniref:Peptidoglycan-binding protein LysM n=2 Tax=Lysobacteraceae TaxID=32033 RepID=A0ABR5NJV3_9GAMM|nr:peptidoglycan-binding protein LysM [Stenotrophomonas sp. Leaf70]KRG57397.1 peptidoglycan-binding protein LysM [Stenotrophomonas nitritireducens]